MFLHGLISNLTLDADQPRQFNGDKIVGLHPRYGSFVAWILLMPDVGGAKSPPPACESTAELLQPSNTMSYPHHFVVGLFGSGSFSSGLDGRHILMPSVLFCLFDSASVPFFNLGSGSEQTANMVTVT